MLVNVPILVIITNMLNARSPQKPTFVMIRKITPYSRLEIGTVELYLFEQCSSSHTRFFLPIQTMNAYINITCSLEG